MFIINKDNQGRFHATMTRGDLQALRAVQGNDWPDLAVLRSNGFHADGADWSVWFASMFNSVQRGLVDYFPRNVIEVYNDLERHQDKHVALEQNIMLHYPNYEFFFARPGHEALVARIGEGLQRILKSGELKEIFLQHENHRQALALVNDSNRTVFELSNPTLSYAMPDTAWATDPDKFLKSLSAK